MNAPIKRTCAHSDGCSRPVRARGWCIAHYNRVRRSGDPGSVEVGQVPTETCTIDGCDRPHRARGWCVAHYGRWDRTGHVGAAEVRSPGSDRPVNDHGEDVGYSGVHKRLGRDRGQAKTHRCVHCSNQARHWAYDHTDPNERVHSRNGPYSTDPARYIPLCVACHKVLDGAPVGRRGGKRGETDVEERELVCIDEHQRRARVGGRAYLALAGGAR